MKWRGAIKRLLAHFVLFAAVGAIGAAIVVWGGLYDISATDQHLRPTYFLLKKALERSVERRAGDIAVPKLGEPAQLKEGAHLFHAHCVQCHGGPGVAPEPFALALRPLATPLARSGRDRDPAFLFWVVKHGIKMTGMPAWEYRFSEAQMWAVVAFVKHLPTLSPGEYAAFVPRDEPPGARGEGPLPPPDRQRGARALEQYACISCHQIPRLVETEARLGPTLHGIARREIIAGLLPNTPENMALFIRDPQGVKPGSAMPNLGVTARDARDMVAYLATLD